MVTSNFTNQLLSIPPITSTNDIKKIRETYEKTETNVRKLRSLDIGKSQYGPVLIFIVMSKLSEDINFTVIAYQSRMGRGGTFSSFTKGNRI